jgi:signal transduction histidine kinase/DNA-binding NarL/FixJ family response regulator
MEKARVRSINGKLGRLVIVAVGLAVLVVAALGAWQESARYLAARRDTLLSTAHAFAAASAGALAAKDSAAAVRAMRGIGRLSGYPYAALEDQSGVIVAEIGAGVRLAGDLELTESEAAVNPFRLLTTRTVEVSVPVVQGGERVGRLRLIGEFNDLASRLLAVLATALCGGLVALSVGLAISLRLQRSITRPLIALAQTMTSIQASHDYDTAVSVGSDDEIGVLASSFKAMIAEVRDRDRQLVDHRDRLEQDVADRTHDLKLAKEDAEAANSAKSEFLATMSHEIRTPMNGMLVMAELLAGSSLPDRERRYAEVIARSGQSLLAIINDILDFSKIESGKLTLEEIAFSPADVVDTVVTLFAERAKEKGLDLAAFVSPSVPETLIGDPVRVTQVLSNLVNNALKFAEKGHVLVSVEPAADGNRTMFRVVDTGIGIPEDKIDTIFSAFSQADQSTTRRFGGTGLGLSICKRLVEAMGGDIGVTSVEGQGSTFAFGLDAAGSASAKPVQAIAGPVHVAVGGTATRTSVEASLLAASCPMLQAPSGDHDLIIDARTLVEGGRGNARRVVAVAPMGDAAGAQAVHQGLADCLIRRPIVQAEWRDVLARLADGRPFVEDKAAGGAPGLAEDAPAFAGARVLVADDSAVNREVACEALARLGIVAATVEDGRAALEAIRSGRFDLVLMDGSMPDLDGYQATRLLREEEAREGRAHLPVVALTAHVVGPAAQAWREAGMDDVLHKPFTVAKLGACLARHLAAGGVSAEAPDEPSQAEREAERLLDLQTLGSLEEMAHSAGSDSFLMRIFGLFREHAPQGMAELRAAAEAADASAVAAAAHKLKSVSLNIGGSALAAALGLIEAEARERQSTPSAAALDETERLLVATEKALALRFQPPEEKDSLAVA